MAYYGEWAGPAGARFRACADYRQTEREDGRAWVQVRRWVECENNFYGTHVATNWGVEFNMYGPGTYGDSGWLDAGWYAYGAPVEHPASAGYTANSGAYYGSATASGAYATPAPTWAPYAPASVASRRDSDSRNTVTWSRNAPAARPYSSIRVQRSVDGGAWADAATLAGTATSWADTSTSAGHYYRYRVGAVNTAGSAWSASSDATYNTPTAPKVSAARSGEAAVAVSLSGVSPTATAVEVQRQGDGGSWEAVYSGAPRASVPDEPGAGMWRYRARATRGELASAWSAATAWVAPMSPPAAPSLSSPRAGSVHALGAALRLSWGHASRDGSAQTAYEAQLSRDGGKTFAPLASGSTGSSAALPTSVAGSYAARVRTAGASGEFGPWSTVSWSVRVPPQVSVEVPPRVRALPFEVAWAVGAMDGSVASCEVSVARAGSSRPEFSASAGRALSLEVGPAQMAPQDGESYEVTVEVRSSHGLTGSGSASFEVSYDAPGEPTAAVSVDLDAGAVEILVGAGAGPVGTEAIDVWRGGRLIASGLAPGQRARDPLPPLDSDVAYEVVARAPSGASSRAAARAFVPSGSFAFVNFGEGWGRVAKAAMNLAPRRNTYRVVETMEVLGQRRPAAMYGEAIEARGSLTADVWWMADLDGQGPCAMLSAWEEAEEWAGDYALRLPRGGAARVAGDVSHSLGGPWNVATVSFDWKEVCGGLD